MKVKTSNESNRCRGEVDAATVIFAVQGLNSLQRSSSEIAVSQKETGG